MKQKAILTHEGRLYIPRDEECPINFDLATFHCGELSEDLMKRAKRAYPEYKIIYEAK